MAITRIKPQIDGWLADNPVTIRGPHGKAQDRAQRAEMEFGKLERVLCDLNTLLERHLLDWLALPQSERVEVVLRALKKL